MKIFGIAGHSGMGKTTLLERLVPEITARGRVVSLIKHSHKKHLDLSATVSIADFVLAQAAVR